MEDRTRLKACVPSSKINRANLVPFVSSSDTSEKEDAVPVLDNK